MVMLVGATMQTACTQDWWDDRKYGDNLTLENITVKGNVLFVDACLIARPGFKKSVLRSAGLYGLYHFYPCCCAAA